MGTSIIRMQEWPMILREIDWEMSPRIWGLILGISSLALFFVFVLMGEAERGKIGAFSFFAISMSLRIRWEKRQRTWFWTAFTVIVMIHIAAIFLVKWTPERNPAIIFAPFTILDIFLIVWILGAAGSD
jgi:bacteriorhodopsin